MEYSLAGPSKVSAEVCETVPGNRHPAMHKMLGASERDQLQLVRGKLDRV